MNFQTKMCQFVSVVIIFRMLKNVTHEKHTGKTVYAINYVNRNILSFNMLLLCIINA